jgi:hypothetical protein
MVTLFSRRESVEVCGKRIYMGSDYLLFMGTLPVLKRVNNQGAHYADF